MGYYITLEEGTISIKIEYEHELRVAISELVRSEDLLWIRKDDVLLADDIIEVFNALRYGIDKTKTHIIINEFFGDKYGDDKLIFKTIAKFVENGSYLQYRGEEGELWRYTFNDGIFNEIYPIIRWE